MSSAKVTARSSGAGVLVDIFRKRNTGIDGGGPEVMLITPPPAVELTDFAEKV